MEFPPASSHLGTLHYIPPNLSALEPAKQRPTSPTTPTNILLWIGGMFDTFLSVSYPLELAIHLPPTWALLTASLGSAGSSWGTSSIAQDAHDIALIVTYLQQQYSSAGKSGKLVLMGHSTGCQDIMEYLTGRDAASRPPVQGLILQAPVSDREAHEAHLPQAFLHEANQLALKMCREGHGTDAMPQRISRPAFGTQMSITAKRWVDVMSPGPEHAGAEDYFSSDLSDERFRATFGKIPPTTPLLILYSGKEENVPASVDKDDLVARWIRIVQESGGEVDRNNGSIVPEATHNLNGCAAGVVRDLVSRVVGFLGRVDNGDFAAQGRE
ncbi:hypothetical protein LTR62_001244 [Meristemomyces frigidus]|uniref:DUF1749-domain-containing protein n=1 Tax=Meristemomyces frigidus TaxID=1508187 RepID=A0AAN7YBV1_9PEZI|nr:hypothetical protein LTR62_001244 [Meristemomyces frigidus]